MFFSVLAVAEGSIIGCQGKLKVYSFQIRIRAFLFGLLPNQREIAENYLPEVGKAQLEAQSATSATSAIAEVALRLNFLF